MVVALVGGVLPAVVAVVGGFLLANWYFTPPYYQLDHRRRREPPRPRRVRRRRRHRRRARRPRRAQPAARPPGSQAEAEALAALAGVDGPAGLGRRDARPAARHVRRSASAAAARGATATDGTCWSASGAEPPRDPERGRRQPRPRRRRHPRPRRRRALGRRPAGAQRVRRPARRRRRAQRLQVEAGKAAELAAANDAARLRCCRRCRTTCARRWRRSRRRSPACASATSTGRPTTSTEFEATIESETDRLTDLVGNLLDMSRLQASALDGATLRPTGVEEVGARRRRQPRHRRRPTSTSTCPRRCPTVAADAALLERALANLDRQRRPRVTAPTHAPRVTAGEVVGDERGHVDIRVIDRGPGIRAADRELVFQPFQRLGDHAADGAGVGPRAGDRPRLRRGDGRRAGDRGHPGRRRDDGRRACRWPSGWRRPTDDAGAGRRRRGADPARPGGQPRGARLRRRPRRDGRAGARAGRPPPPRRRAARPRPAGHGRPRGDRRAARAGRRCRSSCCRRAAPSATRWRRSTPAPTTTCRSRSGWTSCSPALRAAVRRSTARRGGAGGRAPTHFTVDLAAKRVLDARTARRSA